MRASDVRSDDGAVAEWAVADGHDRRWIAGMRVTFHAKSLHRRHIYLQPHIFLLYVLIRSINLIYDALRNTDTCELSMWKLQELEFPATVGHSPLTGFGHP